MGRPGQTGKYSVQFNNKCFQIFSQRHSDTSVNQRNRYQHHHSSIRSRVWYQPGKQNNIFNRFECYVSSDIFKQQSTGIGLSLVKEQVELHKGKISLQSKVNEGSTFTIQFLKGKDHFPPETEFILSDYDERPLQPKENSLFLKDDYEIEEDCKDCNKTPF